MVQGKRREDPTFANHDKAFVPPGVPIPGAVNLKGGMAAKTVDRSRQTDEQAKSDALIAENIKARAAAPLLLLRLLWPLSCRAVGAVCVGGGAGGAVQVTPWLRLPA